MSEPLTIDRLLDSLAGAIGIESARRLVALRADAAVEERLEVLAAKANEGTLNDRERDEYDSCVRVIDVISILQAKAGKLLRASGI
jgi:hypothetical protein